MRNPLLKGDTGNKTLLLSTGNGASDAENVTGISAEIGEAFKFSKIIVLRTCEPTPNQALTSARNRRKTQNVLRSSIHFNA